MVQLQRNLLVVHMSFQRQLQLATMATWRHRCQRGLLLKTYQPQQRMELGQHKA